MKIIRPIQREDLNSFEKIAEAAGSGMMSIPKTKDALSPLIEQSMASFGKTLRQPKNESYLFVLEDLETKEIGGICGIYSKTGVEEPICFYRIESRLPLKTRLPMSDSFVLLHPTKEQNGPSELYSLYLMSQFRKEGLGRLLSYSRFLFMASFPERFDEKIYAELRGYVDANNESPFWKGLGRYFLNLSLEELNRLLAGRRNFYQEGLPEFPLYKMLLSKQVQNAIQKAHKHSKGALKMLLDQGFSLTNKISPVDGGPIVEALVKEIRTVRESKRAKILEVVESLPHFKIVLVSNERLDYRCCYGKIKESKNGEVSVDKETSEALKLGEGDHLRYIYLSGK